MTIDQAKIHFNENGTPYASHFDDLYFSDAQGLAETEHVFIQNNHLLNRWKDWSAAIFVIGETGFGTGLNILTTLLHFDEFCRNNPAKLFSLHCISIEKYPISKQDLTKALALYPELTPYTTALLEQYPEPVAGCHRMTFLAGRVTLDLWLGDVHNVLAQIENQPQGLIDTWFLDGFAPSKNPDMWTQPLFENMAELAKHQCQFSTFTAAGHVRRGLTKAGFRVQKQPGHGLKRDMLAGSIEKFEPTVARLPYFARLPATVTYKKPKVAIIGGGLAGANCAYALGKRGIQTTVYCQEEDLAMGASGNSQGGFYPQLNAEAGHASQIHALSFIYASRIYRQLLSQGIEFGHEWCGVLQLAFNQRVTKRYQKLIENQTWPRSLVHYVDPQQASQLANVHMPYSGLYLPLGGWINLPQLVKALVTAAQSTIAPNKKLKTLNKNNNQWHMTWQDGSQSSADMVVLATGSDSAQIEPLQSLPFRLVRGQVESISSRGELAKLSAVLCHKGYLTPALNGNHALGSTYIKDATHCEYTLAEQTTNITMHHDALADCSWVNDIQPTNTGRASIRCSTPDHLPMAGAVPNVVKQTEQYQALYKALPAKHYPLPNNISNLFMLCGLGSRGLSTAPLCAEILASQMLHEPMPIGNHLLDKLNPNRFLIRNLIRRQN